MTKLPFLVLFARNLKYLIDANDMNTVDLAEKLDTTKSTTARWLRAESFPRKEQFQSLCDFFNVAPGYFFNKTPGIVTSNELNDTVPFYKSESDVAKDNPKYINVAHEILKAHPSMFAVMCTDDAMNSIMKIPSICYVDPAKEINNGDIVLIQIKPNEPPIFRKYTKAGRIIVLNPMTTNDHLSDIVMHEDDKYKVLGVVTTIRVDFDN